MGLMAKQIRLYPQGENKEVEMVEKWRARAFSL